MRRHPATFFCLALAAGLAACGGNGGDDTIVASGHVEATEVTVSTKVGGILEAVPFEEGDAVTVGHELARLETVDTQLALRGARAERDRADADLRLRIAGPREEEIAEAAAEVSRVEVDLAGAERDLERMEGLLASGSGTTKARDDARTRRDVVSAALTSARQRLQRLEAGSRPQEIAAARARLAGADAQIAQLDQQLADAVVRSPIAGVVTRKLAEAGELASRGTGLAVVTDLKSAWLTAYVSGPDLGRIRIGQPVEVITDAGQRREGHLKYVASQAEFTPKNVQTRDERVKLVYRIKVALANEDGLFKPGMPAEARLQPAGPTP